MEHINEHSLFMQEIAAIVFPVFLVIGLGTLLYRGGWMTQDDNRRISWFIFHVAAPALLFRSIARFDFISDGVEGGGAEAALLPAAVIYIASVVFAFGTLLVGFAMSPARRGVLAQGSYRSNMIFIALPIITAAFPDNEKVLGIISLVIGVTIPLYNFIAILVLSIPHAHSQKGSLWQQSNRVLRDTVLNPLILSSVGGIAFSVFSIPIPGPADRALEMTGSIAGPLALISVGISLQFRSFFDSYIPALIAVFLKLILYPAAVLVGMLWLTDGEQPELIEVAVLLAAAPTAIASHIMAAEMNGDTGLSSSIVVLSTILSMFTISAWLYAFRLIL